jgi:hypothetical protein
VKVEFPSNAIVQQQRVRKVFVECKACVLRCHVVCYQVRWWILYVISDSFGIDWFIVAIITAWKWR